MVELLLIVGVKLVDSVQTGKVIKAVEAHWFGLLWMEIIIVIGKLEVVVELVVHPYRSRQPHIVVKQAIIILGVSQA